PSAIGEGGAQEGPGNHPVRRRAREVQKLQVPKLKQCTVEVAERTKNSMIFDFQRRGYSGNTRCEVQQGGCDVDSWCDYTCEIACDFGEERF
ncbi:hypothetical protein U1Q18_028359, partial [Sarracenia purpurea var. burkii]